MITNFKISFIAILLFLFSLNGSSQSDYKYQELDNYISKAVQDFGVPGLSVGIVKNGEVVFNHAYGYRNNSTKEVVTNETVFGIASCSKAFTAACMAILVDEGLVNWDDRVIEHYPEFQMSDPYITSEMRIQDLLCHRSGLKTFDGDLLWYGTNYSRSDVVKRIKEREVSYRFRSEFGYQNVMFIVAGEVIKKVTGESWDEFVSKRIFDPLGMNKTTTTNSGFNKDMNVALPHIDGKPLEFINYDNCGPAASINTSSEDLLKWVKLMLGKGVYENDTVFSTDQYYEITSPHTLINSGPGEKIGGTHFYTYGLGWFMYDYDGRKIIQHGGGLPGFHSKVAFIPEDSLGFVIIANQLSGLVESVYKEILDFYLNDSGKDWAAYYLERGKNQAQTKEKNKEKRKAERKQGTSPSLDINDYVGTYEDKMYGKAVISMHKEKLNLILLPSATLFNSDLEHWHYDTFNFKFKDEFLPEGFLTFSIDSSGKPEYFTIDLENPDFHFYKLKFYKVY